MQGILSARYHIFVAIMKLQNRSNATSPREYLQVGPEGNTTPSVNASVRSSDFALVSSKRMRSQRFCTRFQQAHGARVVLQAYRVALSVKPIRSQRLYSYAGQSHDEALGRGAKARPQVAQRCEAGTRGRPPTIPPCSSASWSNSTLYSTVS